MAIENRLRLTGTHPPHPRRGREVDLLLHPLAPRPLLRSDRWCRVRAPACAAGPATPACRPR
jgi:hypothetical protein